MYYNWRLCRKFLTPLTYYKIKIFLWGSLWPNRINRGVSGSNVCLFDIVRHEKVRSLRVRSPREVLYSGQMIDSPLVTSLYDKKSRWGKRKRQSIQPLRCGAQRRGDALPNTKQQGPRSDAWVCLSPFKPAPLNFCLGELFSIWRCSTKMLYT